MIISESLNLSFAVLQNKSAHVPCLLRSQLTPTRNDSNVHWTYMKALVIPANGS